MTSFTRRESGPNFLTYREKSDIVIESMNSERICANGAGGSAAEGTRMRIPGYPSNREADNGAIPLPFGGKGPCG